MLKSVGYLTPEWQTGLGGAAGAVGMSRAAAESVYGDKGIEREIFQAEDGALYVSTRGPKQMDLFPGMDPSSWAEDQKIPTFNPADCHYPSQSEYAERAHHGWERQRNATTTEDKFADMGFATLHAGHQLEYGAARRLASLHRDPVVIERKQQQPDIVPLSSGWEELRNTAKMTLASGWREWTGDGFSGSRPAMVEAGTTFKVIGAKTDTMSAVSGPQPRQRKPAHHTQTEGSLQRQVQDPYVTNIETAKVELRGPTAMPVPAKATLHEEAEVQVPGVLRSNHQSLQPASSYGRRAVEGFVVPETPLHQQSTRTHTSIPSVGVGFAPKMGALPVDEGVASVSAVHNQHLAANGFNVAPPAPTQYVLPGTEQATTAQSTHFAIAAPFSQLNRQQHSSSSFIVPEVEQANSFHTSLGGQREVRNPRPVRSAFSVQTDDRSVVPGILAGGLSVDQPTHAPYNADLHAEDVRMLHTGGRNAAMQSAPVAQRQKVVQGVPDIYDGEAKVHAFGSLSTIQTAPEIPAQKHTAVVPLAGAEPVALAEPRLGLPSSSEHPRHTTQLLTAEMNETQNKVRAVGGQTVYLQRPPTEQVFPESLETTEEMSARLPLGFQITSAKPKRFAGTVEEDAQAADIDCLREAPPLQLRGTRRKGRNMDEVPAPQPIELVDQDLYELQHTHFGRLGSTSFGGFMPTAHVTDNLPSADCTMEMPAGVFGFAENGTGRRGPPRAATPGVCRVRVDTPALLNGPMNEDEEEEYCFN